MEQKSKLFLRVENKYRRNDGISKSPFDSHNSCDCFRKERLIDVKISGWKFDEKQDIFKISLHKLLVYCKGKNSNFTVEKPGWL